MQHEAAGHAVVEELREVVAMVQQLGVSKMRPWSEFFGGVSTPRDLRNAEERMTTNFLYYRFNYGVVFVAALAMSILSNPRLLFVILLAFIAALGLLVAMKKRIVVQGTVVSEQNKFRIGMGLLTLLLLFSGCLGLLVWCVVVSALVCCVHMVLRPRSISSKTNKMVDEFKMQGGFSGMWKMACSGGSGHSDSADSGRGGGGPRGIGGTMGSAFSSSAGAPSSAGTGGAAAAGNMRHRDTARDEEADVESAAAGDAASTEAFSSSVQANLSSTRQRMGKRE